MPSSNSWPQPAVLSTTPLAMNDTEDETTINRPHRVLALYKFVSPKIPKESLKELQAEIESTCRNHMARGTLLLAEEGVNGTICYPFPHVKWHSKKRKEPPSASVDHDVKELDAKNTGKISNNDDHDNSNNDAIQEENNDALLQFLRDKFGASLRTRISTSDRPVFARLKIKIKSEIVTLHCNNCDPTEKVGQYVKPQEWNALLEDPDTLVIDTRNQYEIDVGTFRNAVNPNTHSFVEFPEWMRQHIAGEKAPKKIAMFCKYSEQGKRNE
jgi:predicted sulfurtransferase